MVLRLTMKKLACLFAAFICCICTTARAGHHLGVQGVFSSAPDNRILSLDLYEQDEETTAVSPLFPEYALSVNSHLHPISLSNLKPLFMSDSDMIRSTDLYVGNLLHTWFDRHCEEVYTGIFDGDLFTGAHEMATCEFRLADLMLYLRHMLQESSAADIPAEDQSQDTVPFFSFLFSLMEDNESLNQATVLARRFDAGIYYSITVRKDGSDILSLSADLSDKDHRRYLTVWKEDQRTYFNDIQLTDSPGQIQIASALYSGNVSSFQAVSESTPLYRESFSLTDSENRQCEFAYLLESDAFVHPLMITGQRIFMPDGSFRIQAAAVINDRKDGSLDLELVYEETNRNVSFSDLTSVDPYNEKESSAARLAFMSSLTLLAAEIIPTLPLSYQQKLLTVFFQ